MPVRFNQGQSGTVPFCTKVLFFFLYPGQDVHFLVAPAKSFAPRSGFLCTKVFCTWDRLGQIQNQSTLHPEQGGTGPLCIHCTQSRLVQILYTPKSLAHRTRWYRYIMHQSLLNQGQGGTGPLCTKVHVTKDRVIQVLYYAP